MNHLSWKNNLPSTWRALPMKAIASYFVSSVDKLIDESEFEVELCNYTDVYKNEFINSSLPFMKATASKDEIERYKLFEGDIIITKDSETWDDIGIPALVTESKYNLLCGYHLAVIRGHKNRIVPKYLLRCLQSKTIRLQLELASSGVTRFGLPKEAIGRLILPVPDPSIQDAIVKLIDSELSRLDSLISSKTSWLALLTEKRQSLITETVSRGIDSSTSLSERFGIPFIGKIPKHWAIKRLKHVTRKIGSGVTPKGGAEVYQREGIPLLRSQNIYSDGLRLDDVAYISPEIHESMSNSKVQKGDVLLNITGASLGRCYYFDRDYEANVNQHVCILRPNNNILTRYLHYLLISYVGQNQIAINEVGGGREGLNFEDIKAFVIPLPSKDEQAEIVDYLESEIKKIDGLKEATEKSIALLKERRESLISEAVTGQLKIEVK